MAITKTFTRDELEDLDVPYICVDRELWDERRWYNAFTGVFEDDNGDHWRIQWNEGATEVQEDTDLWNDEDEVEATKVVLLPVVVQKWVDASE